jgi:O-acetyl-ADP-ribose deacetylase (regulator of RNase III)
VNHILAETALPSGQRLQLVLGDITAEKTDAIVNAANRRLQHGAGVAGAILRAGGAVIQEESDRWVRDHGSVSHSAPAWTSAGALPCRFVIHAVGPMWGEGEEAGKLAAAVDGSLNVAEELRLRSIALPALSTGVFGFPLEAAARVILRTLGEHFSRRPASALRQVRVVLFDQPAADIFLDVWHDHFHP